MTSLAVLGDAVGAVAIAPLAVICDPAPALGGYDAVFRKVHARFPSQCPPRDLPAVAGAKRSPPVSRVLPFQEYIIANMGSCPVFFWDQLHAKFRTSRPKPRTSSPRLGGVPRRPLDLSQIWPHAAAQLDYRTLARLAWTSVEAARWFLSAMTADMARTRLGAPELGGSVGSIFGLGHVCDDQRCTFLPGWDGAAHAIALGKITQARRRFPEAKFFLWQTAFPGHPALELRRPLAHVDAEPAAVVQIGTVTLRLTLRLMCVSEAFFDSADPLRNLLARLEMSVDNGPELWPGGMPGPAGDQLCGHGHRWACVCETLEDEAMLPLFCSLRECYLRPTWRHPRVMARCERPLVSRCQPLDASRLGAEALSAPLRLGLLVFRVDDDDGPDEPEG